MSLDYDTMSFNACSVKVELMFMPLHYNCLRKPVAICFLIYGYMSNMHTWALSLAMISLQLS